jgi:hypothetical protein
VPLTAASSDEGLSVNSLIRFLVERGLERDDATTVVLSGQFEFHPFVLAWRRDMAKRKKSELPASDMDALVQSVQAYERAEYGTIAPNDSRKPMARFGKWTREAMEGPIDEDAFGECLLELLVAAKRCSHSVSDVIRQAVTVATQVAALAEADHMRASDDGMPVAE